MERDYVFKFDSITSKSNNCPRDMTLHKNKPITHPSKPAVACDLKSKDYWSNSGK